eukprot:4005709-Pyramimonas_sp.AAC.1
MAWQVSEGNVIRSRICMHVQSVVERGAVVSVVPPSPPACHLKFLNVFFAPLLLPPPSPPLAPAPPHPRARSSPTSPFYHLP